MKKNEDTIPRQELIDMAKNIHVVLVEEKDLMRAAERITKALYNIVEDMNICESCRRKEARNLDLVKQYAKENMDLHIIIKELQSKS